MEVSTDNYRIDDDNPVEPAEVLDRREERASGSAQPARVRPPAPEVRGHRAEGRQSPVVVDPDGRARVAFNALGALVPPDLPNMAAVRRLAVGK